MWRGILPTVGVLALCLLAFGRNGGQSPHAGQHVRPVKSLSSADVEGLRNGRGMGLAKVAEMNHYPGPMHVLDLRRELRLTPEQSTRIQASMDAMRKRAVNLGNQIIAAEAALESKFQAGNADDRKVQQALAEIANLQGELRWAHVKAHLETRRVLTSDQVAQYDSLRGYAPLASRRLS